jgi:hypothetical protein
MKIKMKIKKLLLLSLFFTCVSYADVMDFPLHGKTFMLTRSQSVNAARDLAGWHWNFPKICDGKNEWYSFTVTPEYMHSFRSDDIAEYFFGNPCLQISGSKVTDRGQNDILADYFGLGQTFSSSVKLEPIMRNALADFRFHYGYDRFYFHVHAPIVWAKNEILLEECVDNDGTDMPFEALYMAPDQVQPVVSSFCQAISQGAVYGEVTEPLRFGRMGCPDATTKLSEIQAAFGWIFLERPNGWMSVNLRGSIPTGTRPNSAFLFEPIVGNGHHGELGIGFYGQGNLWEKDGDKFISVWLEANITHMFGDKQCRTFDLLQTCDDCCCIITPEDGFGSRYILAKEFNEAGNYIQSTVPLINRTTLLANISVDVQLDIALMFAFEFKQWTFDIGYDGWARSRERIDLLECLPEDIVGLKGIQNVALQMGGPSDVTQSMATLHGNEFSEQVNVADPDSPVFTNQPQVDINSGASSRMLTHKIFGNINRAWHRFEPCALQPFLGIGIEVEFEGQRPKDLQPNKLAMSQWGVWLKTGVGY